MNKSAYGGGYGLNKKTGGASSLTTAVPAYGNVRVTPGNPTMRPRKMAHTPKRKK